MLRPIMIAATSMAAIALSASANAGSQVCGWYAFAGAHSSPARARKEARQLGAMALDLRTSDSPNNQKRLWVVAEGPLDKGAAGNLARKWKRKVGAGYIANRCFTGD